MLVDNPILSSFSLNSAIEDFFNLEMLSSGPGAPGSSSSRSSSSSPSHSFSALPPTPPNVFEPGPSSFFNFYMDDDFSKVDPLAPPPTTAAPFDFLSSFTQSASPEGSGSSSDVFSASPESTTDLSVGIDPNLMATPAPSKAMSDFDEGEDLEALEEEMGEEMANEDSPIDAIKVGGKGSKARKGTILSGGIVKKSAPIEKKAKELKPTSPAVLSTTSIDPDDWRPTPEEYKKMSSKEKRQLRNKISARNFRVRRKEYITTLEGDIAERDRLIDAIRTELGSTKNENVALRQEITALKKSLLEGRGRPDTPVLPPPAPLPAIPAAILATQSPKSAPPKSPLLTPNTQKDLPTSPRLANRGFWGGNLGGFGGVTPVHTTLVPDLTSVLSSKPASSIQGRRTPALQENLNPFLNTPHTNNHERTNEMPAQMTPFDAFTDMNPFTLKTLDAYRMQLWGRMAQQQAAHHHHQQQQQLAQQQQSPQLTGLASGLRPHYFAKSPTLSAILSGKPSTSAYPTPPATPQLSHTQPHSSGPTPEQAMLATMASQTLLGKLGGAFWDAFSGSSSPTGAKKDWDADKVRKVLEGKAVLRVVDVEPSSSSPSTPAPTHKLSSTPSSSSLLEKKAVSAPQCLSEMFGSMRL